VKHLKTYDLNAYTNYKNKLDINNFKKYIISEEDEYFYLDEIIGNNPDNNNITIMCHNRYNKNTHSLHKNINTTEDIRRGFLNRVIYTSDNFDNCCEHFDIIININKYNL